MVVLDNHEWINELISFFWLWLLTILNHYGQRLHNQLIPGCLQPYASLAADASVCDTLQPCPGLPWLAATQRPWWEAQMDGLNARRKLTSLVIRVLSMVFLGNFTLIGWFNTNGHGHWLFCYWRIHPVDQRTSSAELDSLSAWFWPISWAVWGFLLDRSTNLVILQHYPEIYHYFIIAIIILHQYGTHTNS